MPRSSNIKPRNTAVQHLNTPLPQRSFLQTMKEGLSFGIGNSLAHRFIGSLSPSLKSPVENKEYTQCMKDTNDKSGCEYLLDKV